MTSAILGYAAQCAPTHECKHAIAALVSVPVVRADLPLPRVWLTIDHGEYAGAGKPVETDVPDPSTRERVDRDSAAAAHAGCRDIRLAPPPRAGGPTRFHVPVRACLRLRPWMLLAWVPKMLPKPADEQLVLDKEGLGKPSP